jgi:hypothetical protein
MSYKACFFGVPFGASLAPFKAMADELRMENGYTGVYLVTSPEAEARATGLRLGYLLATPAPRGRVPREFFTERWSGSPLFTLIYDDQNGYFMFEHRPLAGGPQSVITWGHAVGLSDLTLTIDYPQKPFTNAQLDAAYRKPEAKLTKAEAKALMEPADAITLGMMQFGFQSGRRACLDLVHAKKAWSLLEAKPKEQPIPDVAGPIVAYGLEPYELSLHGLEPRHY